MSSAVASRKIKRPYMRKDRRRRMLLEDAAEIVESEGWDALTMISLSKQAQVSRQTVYEHFSSIDELVQETVQAIFKDVFFDVVSVVSQEGADPVATVAELERLTYDIPPGRARALWQVISASGTSQHNLARTSKKLRHLLTKQYAQLVARACGLPDEQARAVVWMLIMAFWGAYQMVECGELDRRDAMAQFEWFSRKVLAT